MNFEWCELGIVILRGFGSLIILFLIAKLLGKKQVSQLSLFDYVIGISIGNFAAEITINLDASFIYGIVAVALFGVIAYIVSILTMKSIKLRRYFMGTPTVLIEKGKLIEDGLKKVKFDINDLLEQCRTSGYFSLDEIEYAVMEVNGQISFLPKTENRPVTVKDLKLKPKDQGLCANVIIDGKIMVNNLKNINKTEEWLLSQLKIKGYKVKTILLATIDVEDKLMVYEKNVKRQTKNILE